jgi:hypothetical protein
MRFLESEVRVILWALRSAQRLTVEVPDSEIDALCARFLAGEAKPYLPEPQPTLFDRLADPALAPLEAVVRIGTNWKDGTALYGVEHVEEEAAHG